MSYGGENTLVISGWSGAEGAKDEPMEAKLNRILPLRFQISAPQQMAPVATNVEVANTSKLTIPANTLKAGDRLRVRAFGKVTGVNGTPKLTGRIRAGGLTGTAVAATGAVTATLNNAYVLEAEIVFEAIGVGTKYHSQGKAWVTGQSDVHTVVFDDTSLNTEEVIDIVWTSLFDADHASNRFKLYELSAELIRTRQAWEA